MSDLEALKYLIVFIVSTFTFLFALSLIIGLIMKTALKILAMIAYPTYIGLYILEDVIDSQMNCSCKRFLKLYMPRDWFLKACMDFLAGISLIFFGLIVMDIFTKIEKSSFSNENFGIYLVYGVLILIINVIGHLFGEKENKSGMNKLVKMKPVKIEE